MCCLVSPSANGIRAEPCAEINYGYIVTVLGTGTSPSTALNNCCFFPSRVKYFQFVYFGSVYVLDVSLGSRDRGVWSGMRPCPYCALFKRTMSSSPVTPGFIEISCQIVIPRCMCVKSGL